LKLRSLSQLKQAHNFIQVSDDRLSLGAKKAQQNGRVFRIQEVMEKWEKRYRESVIYLEKARKEELIPLLRKINDLEAIVRKEKRKLESVK
jgi:hypothetical protein